MSADRLDNLERTVNRHTDILASLVNYIETDLETSRLEGARLDANTRKVAELERRVAALESAGRRPVSTDWRVRLAHLSHERELAGGDLEASQ